MSRALLGIALLVILSAASAVQRDDLSELLARMRGESPGTTVSSKIHSVTVKGQNDGEKPKVQYSQSSVKVAGGGSTISATPVGSPKPLSSGDNENEIKSTPMSTPGLKAAKIVPELNSNAKRFVTAEQNALPGNSGEEGEQSNIDRADPKYKELQAKLKHLRVNIVNERNWIEDVQSIIAHYRLKITAVQQNIREQERDITTVKRDIVAQHKLNKQKGLAAKLEEVKSSLQRLQSQARQVQGKASSLELVKHNLRRSIESLEKDMQKARRA